MSVAAAETTAAVALRATGVSVTRGVPGTRALVNDVSIAVERGRCLGIVGESGSGKSLLLRSLIGLVPAALHSDGSFEIAGPTGLAEYVPAEARGRRIGMVFQDPIGSLNPMFTIRRTLREPLRQHGGMSKADADARTLELLDEVGIPDPVRVSRCYPHQLSGGMRQRVMIAAALAPEPEVLLCDEPTTAIDVTTQRRILELLNKLRAERDLSVIFVSHDLAVVSTIADRVAVMYCGQVMENGPATTVLRAPAHPYAGGLLASVPSRVSRHQPFNAIEGKAPSATEQFPGCPFAPRCPQVRDVCTLGPVPFYEVGGEHRSRCVLAASSAESLRPTEIRP
jgi:oligopeptide/dipeptide ABC transporter ATP-binding protein